MHEHTKVKKNKKDPKKFLQNVGIRPTKHRLALLAFFQSMRQPMSLRVVSKKVERNMDLVTVYRNTELLVKKGLLRPVDLRGGEKLYEYLDEKDHHHITCTTCNKMSDFTGCFSEEVTKRALQQNKDFSHVESHSFELFGTCKKCYTSRI